MTAPSSWLPPTPPPAPGPARPARQANPDGLSARLQQASEVGIRPFHEAAHPARPGQPLPGPAPAPARPGLAGGNTAPSFGPVIVLTVIFGVLGVISAANRARRARQMGCDESPYWTAFGAVMIGSAILTVVGFLFYLAVFTAVLANV